MNVQVTVAGPEEQARLTALFELYAYDFSELLGMDVADDGRFRVPPWTRRLDPGTKTIQYVVFPHYDLLVSNADVGDNPQLGNYFSSAALRNALNVWGRSD